MKIVYAWLEELGLVDTFAEVDIIRGAFDAQRLNVFAAGDDPDVRARMRAGRLAFNHIAAHLPAYEFFTGAQRRGFQVAIIYSPEEALQDPHFIARGMLAPVEHPELGTTFQYPGPPIRFTGTPWEAPTRAPLLGEHTASVLEQLDARERAP
jgi:crotonobetainyl-CoA:carnitine CoA-transferase CaiB-like acyl-CoA transferase